MYLIFDIFNKGSVNILLSLFGLLRAAALELWYYFGLRKLKELINGI